MSNDLFESILAFLWGFGTVGVILLVGLSIRLRLYVRGRTGDIGIIILDSLVSKNVFLVFALGMVAFARYTDYTFPVVVWVLVISAWLTSIWVSDIRILLWFRLPNEEGDLPMERKQGSD